MYRGQKHGKLDKGCVLDVMSRGIINIATLFMTLKGFIFIKITTQKEHFSIQCWKWKKENIIWGSCTW